MNATWASQHELHLRFVAVGVLNTAFGYGVFAALFLTVGDRFPYLLLVIVSHVIAVLEAFVTQRLLVFHVRGQVLRDLARFWTVYLALLGMNLLALPLLVEVVKLPVLLAQLLVLLASALVSFTGHKRFSFRRAAPGGLSL